MSQLPADTERTIRSCWPEISPHTKDRIDGIAMADLFPTIQYEFWERVWPKLSSSAQEQILEVAISDLACQGKPRLRAV